MEYGIEKEKYLGGWWNVGNEYGDPGTWNTEIWDKIIKDYSIKSIADIGCGLGYSTRYFAQKDIYVVGVEGGMNAINNNVFEGKLIQNDYTKSSAFSKEKFDLIWCCEFVEHVEELYMNNFLNDFKTGENIAMTFAMPGQEGYHHVNCQPQEYWIEKVEKLRYKFNEDYSESLREIAHISNNNKSFVHGGHLTRILFFENE